jgi:DNA-binding response OmpR family regulator
MEADVKVAYGSTIAPSRRRIVLAEGDAGLRRQLTRMLTNDDYDVTSTESGRETLEAIGATRPDLVLLDLQIPKLGSFEVLQRVRETDPTLPVVVLTARAKIGEVPRALELGANDFVVKPVDGPELKQRMLRLLEIHRRAVRAPLRVPLQQLHDRESGRIAADKVAEYLNVPLKKLSEALGVNYAAVHKTPAAESIQEKLVPIKRSLEILQELIGDPAAVRAWLNSPHPDLGLRTPMRVILEGNAGALHTILENALAGIPS